MITVFASRVKREAPTPKAMQTNMVRKSESVAISRDVARVSNTAMSKSAVGLSS